MANSRLSMRKILDVLRLSLEGGRSHREIARAINASPTTVGDLLRRAKLYGVTWPLPAGMSEPELEAQLYPPAAPSNQTRPEPDWPVVHRELRRKGVTLDLLWQEYKTEQPAGYRYSGFCALYRQWVGRLSLSLRQTHAPGEKLFVDYAGQTVPITDPMTGEMRLGRHLRRGARRLQLHLQRSHLEPESAGLDRQPCAHLRTPRRRLLGRVLIEGVDQLVVLIHAQHAVRAERFDGEWAGHTHRFLVLVGFVVEVLELGLGGDRGVDFLLPGDAGLPPVGVQFFACVRPFGVGFARNLPLLPDFLSAAFSFSRSGSSFACHLSQITSISALLAMDFRVMCGTRS
jgi:hypothetical protein